MRQRTRAMIAGLVVAAGLGLGVYRVERAYRPFAARSKHAEAVTSLCFVGEREVAATSRSSLRIWDLANRLDRERGARDERSLEGALGSCARVPGSRAVLLAVGWQAQLVDTGPLRPVMVRAFELDDLPSSSGARQAIAISPNSAIAALTGGGALHLVDVSSGRPLWKVDLENDRLSALAFTADGSELVTAGIVVGTVFGGPSPVNPRVVASRVCVRDARTGQVARTLRLPAATRATFRAPCCLVVHPRDGRAAVGTLGGEVLTWDLASGEVRALDLEDGCRVDGLAFLPGGHVVAISLPGADLTKPTLRELDLTTGTVVRARALRFTPTSLALSPDGSTLAVGTEDGRVVAVDADALEPR